MAIERQQLREELAAVIAAGRELSPEHDLLLSDIYLDLRDRYRPTQPKSAGLLSGPINMRDLVAGACLGLAALAFPLLIFHGGQTAPAPNPSVMQPSPFDPDGPYGRIGPWWHRDGPPPRFQTP
jgi:hypothetical protein